MRIQTIHHKQGRARSCAELMMSTALGGALIVLAGASPAAADDECGAPVAGVVTCTAAGGPYNSGVTYTSAVELRADPNTVINGGLNISAPTGSILLPQAGLNIDRPSVTQSGNATAVSLVANSGYVFAFFNDVSSAGPTGVGIYARSTTSSATVNADVVTAGSVGVDIAGVGIGAYFNEISLVSNGTPGAGIRAVSAAWRTPEAPGCTPPATIWWGWTSPAS